VTQFGDNSREELLTPAGKKNMSEYYLADHKASERALQRERERERDPQAQPKAQDIKVTLLGDFMFPTAESRGCDPYNSSQGRSVPDTWSIRGRRR
jgi:hypothetical protein